MLYPLLRLNWWENLFSPTIMSFRMFKLKQLISVANAILTLTIRRLNGAKLFFLRFYCKAVKGSNKVNVSCFSKQNLDSESTSVGLISCHTPPRRKIPGNSSEEPSRDPPHTTGPPSSWNPRPSRPHQTCSCNISVSSLPPTACSTETHTGYSLKASLLQMQRSCRPIIEKKPSPAASIS